MTHHARRLPVLAVIVALILLSIPVLAAPPGGAELELSPDRYGTSARAALHAFPDGAATAVIASGEDFADALAAAPLAAAFEGPILLTGSAHLPAATRTALEALNVEEILLMGGTDAVEPAVSNALFDYGHVTRIAGDDRFETAARASLEAFPEGADVAVLASGEDFPDALAAAPLAAAYEGPILLTGKYALPAATAAALAQLGVGDVLVMGGAAAVSHDVTNQLHVDYQVSRVAGRDRYGTAARAALDAFPAGADVVVLASGEDFPDALAAAPLAAAYEGPILLTGRDELPEATAATLEDLGVGDVLVMGGAAAVSHDVTNLLHVDYQVSRVAGG